LSWKNIKAPHNKLQGIHALLQFNLATRDHSAMKRMIIEWCETNNIEYTGERGEHARTYISIGVKEGFVEEVKRWKTY
jgi:hypothetical protein